MGDKASGMTRDPPGARAGWLWAHRVLHRGRGMQSLAHGCSFLAPSCRPCPAEGNVAPVYTAMRADVVLHTHTHIHTHGLAFSCPPGAGARAGTHTGIPEREPLLGSLEFSNSEPKRP